MHLIIILVENLATILKRLPTDRQTNGFKFNLSRFLKILKNFRMLVKLTLVPGIEILSLIQAVIGHEIPGMSILMKCLTKNDP